MAGPCLRYVLAKNRLRQYPLRIRVLEIGHRAGAVLREIWDSTAQFAGPVFDSEPRKVFPKGLEYLFKQVT